VCEQIEVALTLPNKRKMSMSGILVSRNVSINGHRTSLRMEQEAWEALAEICRRENMNLHQICSLVDRSYTRSNKGANRTSAIRSFIIAYLWIAPCKSCDTGEEQGILIVDDEGDCTGVDQTGVGDLTAGGYLESTLGIAKTEGSSA
jgi:predicted DNA-binding ribbon-helix-helix protein